MVCGGCGDCGQAVCAIDYATLIPIFACRLAEKPRKNRELGGSSDTCIWVPVNEEGGKTTVDSKLVIRNFGSLTPKRQCGSAANQVGVSASPRAREKNLRQRRSSNKKPAGIQKNHSIGADREIFCAGR
jgi:hypothetical protein